MPNQPASVTTKPHVVIHPLTVRITHWTNAIAMSVMIMSGLQIHNAYPMLRFAFPKVLTLGGWLGGAIRWHFAAMWLLVANGVVYLVYGIASGRIRRKLLPISASAVWRDLSAALSGRLSHADLSTYNAVQRLLYSGVIAAGLVIVLSGLAIWKPVQLGWLTELFGGFAIARIIHFLAMSSIVFFLVVHVAMALLVPRSIKAMIVGR